MANFEENREATVFKGGKVMKLIKFTAIALLLVISFTALVGCEELRKNFYRAEINGYAEKHIDPEFAKNNRIKASYKYNNPELENAPDKLSWIINDREAFDKMFSTEPFSVDFDEETVLVCTFACENLRKIFLKDILVDDGVINVCVEYEHREENDSVNTYQRWLAVKMRKSEATSVSFKRWSYTVYEGYHTSDL